MMKSQISSGLPKGDEPHNAALHGGVVSRVKDALANPMDLLRSPKFFIPTLVAYAAMGFTSPSPSPSPSPSTSTSTSTFGLGRLVMPNGLFGGDSPVSAGVPPNTYSGPNISEERARTRAEVLYNPEEVFRKANYTPEWLAKVPPNLRASKNGFNELLKDGNTVLSPAQREFMRESVSMFIYHDSRVNLQALKGTLQGMSEGERGKFMVPRIDAVRRDALAYSGIKDASKELHQYSWDLAAAQFAMRYGLYNLAEGTRYQRKDLKWPTLGQLLVKPEGDCTAFPLLARGLTRIAAATIPELKGNEAYCQTIGRYLAGFFAPGAPKQAGYHVAFVTRINDNYTFVFDCVALQDVSNPGSANYDSMRNTSWMGPLDDASIGYMASSSYADARLPDKKYEGEGAAFDNEFVGGDRPGLVFNLGNTTLKYLDARSTNKAVTPKELSLMRSTGPGGRRLLTFWTNFIKWRERPENESKITSLWKVLEPLQ